MYDIYNLLDDRLPECVSGETTSSLMVDGILIRVVKADIAKEKVNTYCSLMQNHVLCYDIGVTEFCIMSKIDDDQSILLSFFI